MNGRIVKRKDNYYIEIDKSNAGRRARKYISVRQYLGLNRAALHREAKTVLHKIMEDYRKGILLSPSTATLEEVAQEWIEQCKGDLKPTTWSTYKNYLDTHVIPGLGEVLLSELKPSTIKKFYTLKLKEGRADGRGGGMSPRSIGHMHTVIRNVLKYAVADHLISSNPAAEVTPPRKEKPQINYWTWEEALKFLKLTKEDRYYVYYAIALSTGMGRGEILGLRWQDVDFEKQTVSVRQTLVVAIDGPILQSSAKTEHRIRTLDVSKSLIDILKKHRQRQLQEIKALGIKDTGLVISTSEGKFLNPRDMDRVIGRAVKRSGLPSLSTHGLRHTYATHLLEEGVRAEVVSERLGHSNVNMVLNVYSHITPKVQKAVAKITEEIFL